VSGYSLTEKPENITAEYNTATAALRDHLIRTIIQLSVFGTALAGVANSYGPNTHLLNHSPTTFCILQEVAGHIQSRPRQFLDANFLV
jgi:hypothetical protein